MGEITWNKLVKKANEFKIGVEKEYTLIGDKKWAYYFAKGTIQRKTSIPQISFARESEYVGDDFGRQLKKSEYMDMAQRLVDYVEKNNKLPNYILINGKRMKVRDYLLMFANVIVYYADHNAMPKKVNVNSKAFIKPTETGNVVYDYFVQKTGKKYKYLDDFLDFVKFNYTYQFYYDDHKSNKEVIDSKSGNCTDLLQMCCNMAKAMGYDFKIIHTQCRQSGTGHVYGKFRHKQNTNNQWVTRDIACIVDERRMCVWCDVDNGGGYLLAENPSWFMANLNR